MDRPCSVTTVNAWRIRITLPGAVVGTGRRVGLDETSVTRSSSSSSSSSSSVLEFSSPTHHTETIKLQMKDIHYVIINHKYIKKMLSKRYMLKAEWLINKKCKKVTLYSAFIVGWHRRHSHMDHRQQINCTCLYLVSVHQMVPPLTEVKDI